MLVKKLFKKLFLEKLFLIEEKLFSLDIAARWLSDGTRGGWVYPGRAQKFVLTIKRKTNVVVTIIVCKAFVKTTIERAQVVTEMSQLIGRAVV